MFSYSEKKNYLDLEGFFGSVLNLAQLECKINVGLRQILEVLGLDSFIFSLTRSGF